jgi:hypothetical protein
MKYENLKFTLLGILGCTMMIASIITATSDVICSTVAFTLSAIVTMVSIMSLKK